MAYGNDDKRTDTVIETTPAKVPAEPPKRRRRSHTAKLADSSARIKQDAPESDDTTYMHSIMCQVGFPRSPVFGDEFERACGRALFAIDAGKLSDGKKLVRQPIPYGPWPRLIMAWLNTRALRSHSLEIEVGASASDFIKQLGKYSNGGLRGGYSSFKKQMMALSACHLTLAYNISEEKTSTWHGSPVQRFDAWTPNTGGQRTIWPEAIRLSQDYFDTLKEHAVPLDVRALEALSGSALAMDAYAMLAHRLRRVHGRPVILHWKNLKDQFGQDYVGKDANRNFKRRYKEALKKALAVYPDAKVKVVNGGVLLMPSPPPIPEKC